VQAAPQDVIGAPQLVPPSPPPPGTQTAPKHAAPAAWQFEHAAPPEPQAESMTPG
jgi:hypothetical protein